jgi:hypothetical protein
MMGLFLRDPNLLEEGEEWEMVHEVTLILRDPTEANGTQKAPKEHEILDQSNRREDSPAVPEAGSKGCEVFPPGKETGIMSLLPGLIPGGIIGLLCGLWIGVLSGAAEQLVIMSSKDSPIPLVSLLPNPVVWGISGAVLSLIVPGIILSRAFIRRMRREAERLEPAAPMRETATARETRLIVECDEELLSRVCAVLPRVRARQSRALSESVDA